MATDDESTKPLMLRLISSTVSVVNRAGKIIRDVMNKGELGIVEKGVNDLQTEADRSAQRCIVASLARQFPKVTVIGEENLDPNEDVVEDWVETSFDNEVLSSKCPEIYATLKEEEVVIWVDPLDGTSEYTQGLLDHVTVLVGVAVNGQAVGGVIHQPFYNYKDSNNPIGRTIWGLVGLGAYGMNHKLPPLNQRIITTTRSHSNKLVQASLEALKPDTILKVGGAGHKVLMVAEGQAHAYVFASAGCKKWDTCAPEAILHSLGGRLTDIHGNDLQYHADVQQVNSAGVLATYDKLVHNWYLEQIPKNIKDALPPVISNI